MNDYKFITHLDSIEQKYILDELKQIDTGQLLLNQIDFSAADLYKDYRDGYYGYYVGPITLGIGLCRAAIIGHIHLEDELAEEVMVVSQIEGAQTVDGLPTALVSDNHRIRELAERRYKELTGREPTN